MGTGRRRKSKGRESRGTLTAGGRADLKRTRHHSPAQGSTAPGADAPLHYVSDHRDMIRHDQCPRRGWRIGSAPTQSQCRAVPDRVKGPGKRWDADNAEALMTLECIDQSHLADTYWATRAWQTIRPSRENGYART